VFVTAMMHFILNTMNRNIVKDKKMKCPACGYENKDWELTCSMCSCVLQKEYKEPTLEDYRNTDGYIRPVEKKKDTWKTALTRAASGFCVGFFTGLFLCRNGGELAFPVAVFCGLIAGGVAACTEEHLWWWITH
jgi:hypothetical protein